MHTRYLPLSPSDYQKLQSERIEIINEVRAEVGISQKNFVEIHNAFWQGPYMATPQNFQFYLEYKEKNTCTLSQLIGNTLETYEHVCQKRLENYVKKGMSDFQKQLETERYKNRLSKTQLSQIVEFYTYDNTLTDLEEIDIYENKPYFLLLYNLLMRANEYLYIISERFDNTSFTYKLRTYPNAIMTKLTQANRSGNEYDYDEARLHKNLLDNIKKNDILGFAMLNSLRVADLEAIREMVDYDEGWHLVKNNKNFYRSVDKVNFTKKELVDGLKNLFYDFFLTWQYEKRKAYVNEFNKTTIRKIDHFLVKKENIFSSLKNIFSFLFKDKKELKSSYKKVVPVHLLKYYQGIPIITTKDVKPLDDAFFNLYIKEIIQSTELKAKILLKRDYFYWMFSQLRVQFY